MRKMLAYLMAIVVLSPVTVVAAPLSVVGLLVAFNGIVNPNITSPLALFSAITLGDLGLASMWILFFHYRKKSTKPPRSKWHYGALLGGAAVSLTLAISTGETVFFGWPLIGAVFSLGLLITSRKSGVEEFCIPPHSFSSG